MPSAFPGSPRLLKGALAVFETTQPVATNTIVFQYNPDQVSRRLEQPPSGDDPRLGAGDPPYVLPPTETYELSVELDAADQLEQAEPVAVATGLHPTLAALELLLYPPSSEVLLAKALSALGSAYVTPAQAPVVLLVWGPLRVVPVRVEAVSVTEQAFDQLLNPIRASVDLRLRALTAVELSTAGPPFSALGLVNLIAKEGLARTRFVAQNVENAAGFVLPSL
jgi:hypothetical protein